MRYSKLMILATLAALLLAVTTGGCATDANLEESTKTRDARSDVEAEDVTPDAAPDTAEDTADARIEDAGEEDAEIDACGVCCPGEQTCLEESRVGICRPDGSGYTEETCEEDQTCADGACIARPVCTDGETACHDAATRLVCRTGGGRWRSEACAPDTSCVQGQCVSGYANGEACAGDSDCAGGKCRCGNDESCTLPTTGALEAYCTASCTPGSCGPGEVCVKSKHLAGVGYDHCLPACNQTCPLPGMTCAHVPTMDSGELTFEQACFPDGTADIGERCEQDDACSGGTCLTDFFDFGFCTTECSGNCPQGTACVELEAGSGVRHCSPICGDGSPGSTALCPLEGGEDLMGVTCNTKVTAGGGFKKVCDRPTPSG